MEEYFGPLRDPRAEGTPRWSTLGRSRRILEGVVSASYVGIGSGQHGSHCLDDLVRDHPALLCQGSAGALPGYTIGGVLDAGVTQSVSVL